MLRFFFLLAISNAFFLPPPRKVYVSPRPVFKKLFGNSDRLKKSSPPPVSPTTPVTRGSLTPEELISEAKRLREDAIKSETELIAEKLRQLKLKLQKAERTDAMGVKGSEGTKGSGGVVGVDEDENETVASIKKNIDKLERVIRGEGEEEGKRGLDGDIDVTKKDGIASFTTKYPVVSGRGNGNFTTVVTADDDGDDTGVAARAGAAKELYYAVYKDLPGFMKPWVTEFFQDLIGVSDLASLNSSKTLDEAIEELSKLYGMDKFDDLTTDEQAKAMDKVFDEVVVNPIITELQKDANATMVSIDPKYNNARFNGTNLTLSELWDELKVFEAEESSDLDMMVSSTMPSSMTEKSVSKEEIDVLQNHILKPSTGWESQSKGESVPGGWIIRGKWRGNVTLEEIDKLLLSGGGIPSTEPGSQNLEDISVCYVVDPTPLTEDQIELGQEPSGVLYVTRKPDVKQSWLASVVTGFSLLSLAAFSLGGFALNDEVVRRLEQAQETTGDVGWLLDLATPVFIAVAAQQAAKDFGRILISVSENVKLTAPAIVPSLNFGLLGSVVKCKTSPRDRNALFDLGVIGPSIGIGVGMLMLVLGLFATSSAGAVDLSSFPRLPVSFLRSSALAGGLVDAILGDVLGGPDPNAAIALHPLALAGYAGIVTSALSALPIGNTDGGRVSLSIFGRSGASVVNGLFLFVLLIAGLFGSDVLLYYGAVAAVAQRELEVPCRDEVSEASSGRVVYTIVLGCVAALAILPLPIQTPF